MVSREEQIEELINNIMECNIKYLYKYRSMKSPELVQRLEEIFKNNYIYLSDPTSFNDPFECRPILTIPKSMLKRDFYIKNMIRTQFPLENKKEQNKLIKEAKFQINNSDYQEHVYREFIKTIGIYSLSEKNNDILMWGHYANAHKGLCIEFDASQVNILFGLALKVYYSDKYPIVNTFDLDKPEEFQKALLTKSNHWDYEKEWRILKLSDAGGPGKHYLSPELITGVIMGALISPQDKERVLGWVSNYPTKINIYQATINRTEYKLDIELN
jgi:hypothetical protein